MRVSRLGKVLGAAFAALLCASCASAPSVYVQVQRTPNLDTSGIRRIAIQPFSTADNSAHQKNAALWLTSEAQRLINAAAYFTIVDYNTVSSLVNGRRRESLANQIDAVFTGQIVSLTVNDTQKNVNVYDSSTKQNVTKTQYERQVELSFTYNLQRTRDGSLTGVISKRGSAWSSAYSHGELKNAQAMIQSIASNQLRYLARDVAPWTETRRIKLLPAKSNFEKPLKALFEEAASYVKSGSLKQGIAAYRSIYETGGQGLFEAGYNVSLLYEALGDLDSALLAAEALFETSGNLKAQARIAEINAQAAEARELDSAYHDTVSLFDKAIAHVTPLLRQVLPPSEYKTVSIQRVSRAEASLTDRAAGQIAYELQSAYTIIDRQNAAISRAEIALQEAEWDSFDEKTMAGFGRQAGIQAFVLVSITGLGADRRLKVSVLDVSTGAVIWQSSPASDELKI